MYELRFCCIIFALLSFLGGCRAADDRNWPAVRFEFTLAVISGVAAYII